MARLNKNCWLLFATLLLTGFTARAQRVYAPHSVLANGSFYRLSVGAPGVYKLDLAFLSKLGIPTNNLSSASIRLFGNGGFMLPESPSGRRTDDLTEVALWVEDGGDGTLDGNDYLLFYAPGPHPWMTDTLNRKFSHQKNLYAERSYYYITIGTGGKRIPNSNFTGIPTTTINSYDSRYYYELDTFNFLSSGKQWFGEEFSNLPGKTLSRSFPVSLPGLRNQTAFCTVNVAARAFGQGSRFSVKINTQEIASIDIPAVGNGAYDFFAQTAENKAPFTPPTSTVDLKLDYTPGSFDSQGWLNWFEIQGRSDLSMKGVNQLLFRDWNSVAAGAVGSFSISDAGSLFQVWDVSDPANCVRMQGTLFGTDFKFSNPCSSLHEYVAFTNTGFLVPETAGKIANQDLHGLPSTNYIIITTEELLPQARRLADYHKQKEGITNVVVTANQVFNEFSSGTPDPVAIRDFVKMFYDRAGSDTTKRPRYLLLMGDASFDYKNRIRNNTNGVPAYESDVSLDPLNTYTTDDFFGFLDDGDVFDGPSTILLDIGTGRIPAGTLAEATQIVDKIIAYNNSTSLGPWRNEMTFIADDEDGNLHLNDAEQITAAAAATSPVFSINKIYLDAYKQESGSGGSRYPEVNLAIANRVNNGTLIWNYSGHGSYRRLAEEVVLDQDIINSFKNAGKLPLFITATCDVAPFDNPLIQSIGENLLLRPSTGAIALMTTTRLVFAFSNRIMNKNYLEAALKRQPDGSYPTLGDAVKRAKNFTYTFFGDAINNRKFTLLGDPAFTIGWPRYQVQTTAINGIPVSAVPDTLKALSTYTIGGEVKDESGNSQPSFKGTVYVTIYDKKQSRATLGNDPGSPVTTFTEQKNILFKGKASVDQGKFEVKLVVPKDIDYRFGNGKISFYAENGVVDGNGANTSIIIGGTGTGSGDLEGPVLKAWMNDEKFVDGSITNSAPLLLVKLTDSSGINILGAGIGHDLEAILDGNTAQPFVLNAFYESELDNYKKGSVRFQLPALENGIHTLRIKAWDVVNNSSEITVSFRVVKEDRFTIEHVLNYPNPFTTHTAFWFEHNRPGEELKVSVQVFTVSGRLVKTLRNTIFSTGNRSVEVEWDGRDEYGSRLGRGVYIYRLKVQTTDGKSAEKWEKIYLL